MNYTFTKDNLHSIEFDDFYKQIVIPEDKNEFFGKPGKEHYRLLCYLSTLFNHSNIIDLGTHLGNSALALSYNKSNTIYSFDIVDKVRTNTRNIDNIQFILYDLFNVETRNKYKDLILSCPFIFLDVDPNNGKMEYDFISYLQEINYQGFVVCDDIWYFKEMRDNFWYKINDKYRYDLTDLGHWSGTGIITFNESITFIKNDNANWTLVTAYFNLTKCYDASEEINKRDANYYLSHSMSTLHLPYHLVIYCDEESLPLLKQIRPNYLENKTQYIIKNFEDFQFKKNGKWLNETFNDYRKMIIENRKIKPYYFDNRNTASYYLFCMSRYAMLKEVIETNYFQSTHFAWINFCIERMGYQNVVKLDEALSIKRNKFSTCYIDYIPENLIHNTDEYFKFGRCSMCSGFFTGNKEYMYKVCELIEYKFLYYLGKGYGHADEQLYSPVYFENPHLFEHYYGDYQQMITNYTYIYECPEPPIYNFIKRSFENGNYVKCYEACNFLCKSIFLNKCTIDTEWLEKLFWYYIHCKKNNSDCK
jgi:predicted O-methyltransferase YrrM